MTPTNQELDERITAEDLHAAADQMTLTSGPEEAGTTMEALERFAEESSFHAEQGDPGLAMANVSLVYGIALGLLAARAKWSPAQPDLERLTEALEEIVGRSTFREGIDLEPSFVAQAAEINRLALVALHPSTREKD